jgi:prepilin-type N-terminal cleavage/methylation domain-containing protein
MLSKIKHKKGFTLVELMVSISISLIVVLGIGVMMIDTHRGWRLMYNRVHGDVPADVQAAMAAFDSIVRKSSASKGNIGTASSSATLYYYQNSSDYSVEEPDAYAKFYFDGTKLKVDYGLIDSSGNLLSADNTAVLARNVDVQSSGFAGTGRSVQMVLKLDDSNDSTTVVSCAVRNNE